MERHRRFTLSYPLSCNTGLVFCNDAPLSLQPSLQALSSSVPTPWLMAPSQQTLPITAGAPLLTVFEGRYPALIWGWLPRIGLQWRRGQRRGRERRDEEGHRWRWRHTRWYGGGQKNWGHQGTKGGLGASATPSASKTPRRTNHHHLLQHCSIVSNLKIWTKRRLWTISNLNHIVPQIPLSVLGELRLLVWFELTQLTGRVVFKEQVSLVVRNC